MDKKRQDVTPKKLDEGPNKRRATKVEFQGIYFLVILSVTNEQKLGNVQYFNV